MSRFSRGAGSTRGPGKCVLTAGRPSAVPVTPVCLVSELVAFSVTSPQLLPPGSSLKYLQGPRVSQRVLGELRLILLNGGNESGCDQLPSGPLSRACGESRLENVAGELASHGHRKETNARHQCSDFVCLYNSGRNRALAAGMFPEVRKGQGSSVAFARLQTHLVSRQAGGTSLRNRLLLPWDTVLKEASVTSGSSLCPSAVPFPSTLPCGALVPGGQRTQCIHTWAVSVLGSCSGAVRVSRSGRGGVESGASWGGAC